MGRAGLFERNAQTAGNSSAATASPAMQRTPPDTTETRAPNALATAPASMSPTYGPPTTIMKNMEVSRPRNSSGVRDCMIVVRQMALRLSAAPATARRARAIHSELTNPNAMIAAPQMVIATTMIRPRRRTRLSHPVEMAARAAPAPGAAYSNPSPSGPAWNVVAASTGKIARGRPNTIAHRSIAKPPRMTGWVRANWKPRRIASRGGSWWTLLGGWAGSLTMANRAAANVATSIAYASGSPERAMMRPPTAGPAIIVVWYIAKFSENAPVSRGADTTLGMIAVRVGESTAAAAAPAATTR